MCKHYAYRVEHDVNFAPHIVGDIAMISGCKHSKLKPGSPNYRKNIEESVEEGSWIIGIGGNNTKHTDKIIFVFQVEEIQFPDTLLSHYPQFRGFHKKYHRQFGPRVLISRKFWYFNENALEPPINLKPKIGGYYRKKLVDAESLGEILKQLNSTPYGMQKGQITDTKSTCKVKR